MVSALIQMALRKYIYKALQSRDKILRLFILCFGILELEYQDYLYCVLIFSSQLN